MVIASATDGASIHYTMTNDNTEPTDPTESDPIYSTPISVTISKTKIKAKAFKNGMTASTVALVTYIIKPNKPTVFAEGSTVTITGDAGCTFRYLTDGNVPDSNSPEYTAPLNLNADCTIKVRAYDTYGNSSDVSTFTYKYIPLAPKNVNSGFFVKVTDANNLEDGDAILIVYETENVAMSTTQNDNNRGNSSVTISNNVINSPAATVQKLTLVKDNSNFYLYAGSGKYLYASSSSQNYLKSTISPDNNAIASISVTNGNAIITFQGSNTRNTIKYNDANNQKIFSCYAFSDIAGS